MFEGGCEMWTIVDTNKGMVVHCECYNSAVAYRQFVGYGVIVREDDKLCEILTEQARRVYGQY